MGPWPLPHRPTILKTTILVCLDHIPQYTRMDGPRSHIEGSQEITISVQVSIVRQTLPQEYHHL
ncbi:hypothetical protein AMTRI_Chr06g190840 [Amborella trichopoda]